MSCKREQHSLAIDGGALVEAGQFGEVREEVRVEHGGLRPDGGVEVSLRHRLSFRANPDGTVRQLWETSADGGTTWTTSFDGLYTKRKS